MDKVRIVVKAENVGPGALVLGHFVSATQPKANFMHMLEAPVRLTRIYKGYGKIRAETGTPPRKGFGELIGWAEITFRQINEGNKLWLMVED